MTPPPKRSASPLSQILFRLPLMILVACVPALAQLAPSEPDPLERIRDAAKSSVVACSATGATLCEQVAPKIVASAEGDSPLADDLHRLEEEENREATKEVALQWAVRAFQNRKLDVHVEKHSPSVEASSISPRDSEDVVAEIQGRERADEWVLIGTHFDSSHPDLSQIYNAALIIEAAHAIQMTGIHPRRSIRFVLFDTGERPVTGGSYLAGSSWDYVQAHRSELDRLSGAIIFDAGANPLSGYVLNGRRDIEPGVREALEPIYAMGVTHYSYEAPLERYSLDFLLEGVPTVLAPGVSMKGTLIDKADIPKIRRNAAIAGVTAFGIAERAESLGPRQSRAEIEALLKSTGLEDQMKDASVWPLWESGKRGRIP